MYTCPVFNLCHLELYIKFLAKTLPIDACSTYRKKARTFVLGHMRELSFYQTIVMHLVSEVCNDFKTLFPDRLFLKL
jgi:hypothetical protein